MQAMMLTEYKRLELTDVPQPTVGEKDLLVRIRACGICGSDIHGFDGSSGRRIPPIIMGHEAAGIVEQIGSATTQFSVGDRVTFDSMISCGNCSFCRAGKINLCDSRRILGVSCDEYRQHGAFAEFVSIPEKIACQVPEGLTLEQAALVEPVSVAVHAVNLSPFQLGQTAVVIGCGTIGLLCVQSLRARGCGQLFAVDPDASRRQRALHQGADEAFDPGSCDVPAEIAARTGGLGAHLALEAVGATDPVKTAVTVVRKGGAVTLVGNVSPHVEFPLQSVVTREIQLSGTCGSSGEYPECLQLMSRGAIQVEPLITAVESLSTGPNWFDRLYAQEAGLLKVILQPGND